MSAPVPPILRQMFDAAVAAAQPALCVPPALPKPPTGKTIVLGAGKAAAAMAQAVDQHWPGPLSGTVVTRYGDGLPCERIHVLEANHPTPDESSVTAARQILAEAYQAGADDLVLVLLSGGGSSLLSLPAAGISLADKIDVNRQLLASGAPISAINTVRKHVSAIKGGRLAAAAAPARVITLAISDVAGDDPATIASGPTVGDPTTQADAIDGLQEFDISVSDSIRRHLSIANNENPNPDDVLFDGHEYRLIATPQSALDAAATVATDADYQVKILGDAIEGEAQEVGAAHAALARKLSPNGMLLSGGELTVTVTGTGKGGPNTEYLLALAVGLDGTPDLYALAADTDGIDGTGDNAGAMIDPTTLARATTLGLDPHRFLKNNDAYGFFSNIGDILKTGPTKTNVNDIRVIINQSQ